MAMGMAAAGVSLCCCRIISQKSSSIASFSSSSSSNSPQIKLRTTSRFSSNSNNNNNVVVRSNSSLSDEGDWVVMVEPPPPHHQAEAAGQSHVVDYYVKIVERVLRGSRQKQKKKKDAEMCIYDVVSLQPHESDYGFCCQLDDQTARELAALPAVISVTPNHHNHHHQDFRWKSSQPTNIIKTKKLFVTGLSFYTSEKTLREAFQGLGELVEVKIIMDKISKRSKGYAFIEYTTEEAAAAALKEMNGKIINGWMIVVDVAKTNPPKYSRRPAS